MSVPKTSSVRSCVRAVSNFRRGAATNLLGLRRWPELFIFQKLRIISPAPVSSTMASAISTDTNTARSFCCLVEEDVAVAFSRNTSSRFSLPNVVAGSSPNRPAVRPRSGVGVQNAALVGLLHSTGPFLNRGPPRFMSDCRLCTADKAKAVFIEAAVS